MDIGYMVNQQSQYSIFISMTFKDNFKLYFVEPTQENTIYYPQFMLGRNNLLTITTSALKSTSKKIPSDFFDKQILITIHFVIHDAGSFLVMKVIGSRTYTSIVNPTTSSFSTNKIRIDPGNNIINKIGYHNVGENVNMILILEELKNGTYIPYIQ